MSHSAVVAVVTFVVSTKTVVGVLLIAIFGVAPLTSSSAAALLGPVVAMFATVAVTSAGELNWIWGVVELLFLTSSVSSAVAASPVLITAVASVGVSCRWKTCWKFRIENATEFRNFL